MKDPFDILRGYTPIDPAEVDLYANAHAEEVKERILASPRALDGGRQDRRPSWRRVAAVAASVAVFAAAAFVVTRPAETTDAMACYEDLSLSGVRIGLQPDVLETDACADVWADGSLENTAIVPAGEIPPLVGCVDENGTVAVFPTSNAGVCATLGLDLFDESPSTATGSIVSVQEHMRQFIASSACVSVADATAEAQAQLAMYDLEAWSVAAGTPTVDRPCASFGVDNDGMTLDITPIPQP